MLNKKLILPIVLCFMTISCCSKKSNDSIKPRILDLTGSRETEWVKLSSIATSITYIPLELTENSFVGQVKQIQITDHFILLTDRIVKRVLLFNRDGTFKAPIGIIGKGPGEYSQAYHAFLTIDESKVVVSVPGDDYMVFNIEGEFIRKFPKATIPLYSIPMKDFIVNYIMYPNTKVSDGYSIELSDYNGEIQKKLLYRGFIDDSKPMMGPFSGSYNFKDTTCFWEYGFDTIYGVSNDGLLTSRWEFLLPHNRITLDDFYESQFLNGKIKNGSFVINNIIESDNYFFIKSVEGGKRTFLLVNKETSLINKIKGINELGNTILSFDNDIDNGLAFWPEMAIDSNTLIKIIQPSELVNFKDFIEKNKKKILSSELNNILNNISDNDNLILMIVKLSK